VAARHLKLYDRIVDALSFSGELYKLRRELNARIDQPAAIEPDPRSHPLGVARWFKKRRISIAEAYLMVVRDLDSRHSRMRLRALKMLVNASFHNQALDMPLNTARVQLALIKEAVKKRDDRRRQLELLQDFSASSYGQGQTIRKLLDRLNLVELPETGKRLRDLDAGIDLHVHDTATSGRKNPTQLLTDAFIKGLCELTIAYNGFSSMEMMEEAVEAGRAVGIKVNIGIEIGLDFEGARFHFMAILPEVRRAEDLRRFFDENRKALHPLISGLEEDQKGRVAAIRRLLAAFNKGPLQELNEGFPDRRAYRIPKLRMRKLAALVPLQSANRAHLGEFLWQYYKPAMFSRVLYLKVQRGKAIRDHKNGLISDWDLGIIESRYSRARSEYRMMNPEILRRRYFPDPADADHASAFADFSKLRRMLNQAGCGLKLIQPLEHGFSKATRILELGRGLIDKVEVYNVKDMVRRDPEEIVRLCRLVNDLNSRSALDGKKTLVPVCGSDATGRSPDIPGMGFIGSAALTGKYSKRWAKRHVRLPRVAAALIQGGGKPVDLDASLAASRDGLSGSADIFCMGKITEGYGNRLGDEEDDFHESVPLSRALRYVNPVLANIAMVAVGFTVADIFIGPAYACLWLGITSSRNALADLVAFRGAHLRQWNVRNVNWRNVAQSLFWTGFSVPIMAFIKARFDLVWPLAATGLLYNAVKFFALSFANGVYIMSHNKLRGFDPKVRRANLFRTIISWPFATFFAPLGYSLGIPSIVQSKIWSDVVAGFIEGSAKYFKTLRLRRRDVEELVPRIIEAKKEDRAIAVLDLLYLFREEPRTRNSLHSALKPSPSLASLLRPRDPEANRQSPRLDQLAAIFADDRLDRLLVSYALTRHAKEMAVDLIRIISETLPEFRDWLGGLCRSHRMFEPALPGLQRASQAEAQPEPEEKARPKEKTETPAAEAGEAPRQKAGKKESELRV
jgi:hypothetical protein